MDEPRNQSEEPLPGSTSDQNAEEAEPGHGGGDETRRKDASDRDERSGDGPSGGAGEDSQATGDPNAAG
ncbi:MAG: hypothetical protein WAK93_18790 [Solirubrobacteraceae bacterium]